MRYALAYKDEFVSPWRETALEATNSIRAATIDVGVEGEREWRPGWRMVTCVQHEYIEDPQPTNIAALLSQPRDDSSPGWPKAHCRICEEPY